ncbi:MAG: hypothetical protein RLZZ306_1412 [Bacteroidota bacterium]|jgi:hypothetical protein
MNKTFTKFSLVAIISFTTFFANAQMMNDGIFMAKGNLCGGLTYMNDSWSKYWEGTYQRENKNLGTLTTQSVILMGNYGISDRFNVMLSLPYITTKASAGTSQGMSGIQDLTMSVKYRLIQTRNLSVIGSIGGSIPTNNYVADYLPFAIGTQAKTAFGRGILYYTLPKNLALTVHGTYTGRSNVRVDREMYFAGKGFFTNEMLMPNVSNWGAKFGHYSYRWQFEATFDQQITDGNLEWQSDETLLANPIDIRRNDMPGLCSKFDFTRVGFIAAYRVPVLKDLQIMVTGGKILSGRNVGESTTYSIGISKYIDFRKHKTAGIPSGPICRPGDMNHNAGGMEMKEEHK